ncbi:MAG: hypothetical protein K6F04_00005, partial [bacterium]|nr:hypothetical protein [bacterium]
AEGFYGGSLTWSGPRPMHEYHSGHYRTSPDTVPFLFFYILTFGSPYQLLKRWRGLTRCRLRTFVTRIYFLNNIFFFLKEDTVFLPEATLPFFYEQS